jgi:hypothetical protein
MLAYSIDLVDVPIIRRGPSHFLSHSRQGLANILQWKHVLAGEGRSGAWNAKLIYRTLVASLFRIGAGMPVL